MTNHIYLLLSCIVYLLYSMGWVFSGCNTEAKNIIFYCYYLQYLCKFIYIVRYLVWTSQSSWQLQINHVVFTFAIYFFVGRLSIDYVMIIMVMWQYGMTVVKEKLGWVTNFGRVFLICFDFEQKNFHQIVFLSKLNFIEKNFLKGKFCQKKKIIKIKSRLTNFF